MRSDKLFMMRNCPDCAKVKTVLNMQVAYDDDFEGTSGQTLSFFYTLSNSGTRELLDQFDLEGYFTPVLVTFDGEILTDAEEIIEYLEREGMTA
jgi:glutaredoxin-related protein